jgi:hypothetical protein
MSELTLDKAIKHCLEVAEQWGKTTVCRECAADHRQLAEWLMELKDLRAEQNDQYTFIRELMDELKEAKRLLKAAVEDFETIESNLEYDEHCVIKTHSIRCDECPLSAATIYRCKWRHADETLKLIGGN